jgi:hypothetical protein
VSALNTVGMLHDEYEKQFGHALDLPGDRTEPLSTELLKQTGRVGLAFSGGGIRSATFSLGVVQALARLRLLTTFHYLSTVSGGGYIGSWLSAWAYRHPRGIAGVMHDLAPESTAKAPHEPEEITHLRRYSNYLTPRTGFMSADTWAVIATYVRNLLVNWLVLVPYFALALLVPMLADDLLPIIPASSAWLTAFTSIGGMCLIVSIAAIGASLPSVNPPDAARTFSILRAQTRKEFFFKIVLPLLVGGSALACAWFIYAGPKGGGNETLLAPWLQNLPRWLMLTLLGVVAHIAALSVYYLNASSLERAIVDWRVRQARSSKVFYRQLFAVVGSGAFGGWTAWLATEMLQQISRAMQRVWTVDDSVHLYVVGAVPAVLASFLLAMTLYAALASQVLDDDDREWFARAGGWISACALGWVGLTAVSLLGPGLMTKVLWPHARLAVTSIGGLSGVVTMWLGRSANTNATPNSAVPRSPLQTAAEWALKLAAPLFALFLALMLASGLHGLHALLVSYGDLRATIPSVILIAGCLVVIAAALTTVNVNVFSLHGMYRERLIRAYLGASRSRSRQPDNFTGFDPKDNVPLAYLAHPYFSVEEWPLIYAIATALQDPSGVLERVKLDEIDSRLVDQTVAIRDWVPAAVQDKVRRFNDVLVVSNRREAQRADWEVLVTRHLSEGAFGVHEWWDLVQVARALKPGSALGATILDRDPRWAMDALAVSVWSAPLAKDLTSRLNMVVEAVPPSAEAPTFVAASAVGQGGGAIAAILASGPTSVSGRANLFQELRNLVPAPPKRPLPLVNTAINLVAGTDLAWQERQADSFTLTALHGGSPSVGYRAMAGTDADPRGYGGRTGVSLGTAITISGAAANPNMGYHSSSIVTLLLTLFNARLGSWLGNPRYDARFNHSCPQDRVVPMALHEAFGFTDANGDYVNLSDGGHFENLGLYELVRRGCSYVLVIDAGCDENYAFEDLGNAVRKIRVDLGISISFRGFHVGPEQPPASGGTSRLAPGSGKYVAIGEIQYSRRDPGLQDGKLLYVKPAIFAHDEPIDVRNYGRTNPKYPHESTTDQWFSESQFESYRALGEHIVWTVSGTTGAQPPPATIAELFARAESYVRPA